MYKTPEATRVARLQQMLTLLTSYARPSLGMARPFTNHLSRKGSEDKYASYAMSTRNWKGMGGGVHFPQISAKHGTFQSNHNKWKQYNC